MKRIGTKGFTLIEMLVVIVMMAVIMGTGLALFNGFKGSAISSGGQQVYATLNLARQYAVTQRTYVAVVFSNGTDNAGAFSTYAVMTNSGSSLAPLGRWELLPKGAVFNTATVPSGCMSYLDHSAPAPPYPSSISFPGVGAMVFGPTGAGWNNYGVVITATGVIGTPKNYVNLTVDNLLGTIQIRYPQ